MKTTAPITEQARAEQQGPTKENPVAAMRLMKAAPALLAALKEMLAAVELEGANGLRFHEARNSGLQAVLEAEGKDGL